MKHLSLKRFFVLLFSLTFLTLFTSGCKTYFGYDDIKKDVVVSEDQSMENETNYIVLSNQDEKIEVTSFRTFENVNRSTVKTMVVGKKEYYANFDGDYYLNDKVIHPFPEYKSLTKKWGKDWESLGLNVIKNMKDPKSNAVNSNSTVPLVLLIECAVNLVFCVAVPACVVIIGGGCGAMIDLTALFGAMMIDACAPFFCYMWTGLAVSGCWAGRRMFGWVKDWNLAEHSPNILYMISYMPFINLFFPFQTPPYLAKRYNWNYDKIDLPESEWKVLKNTYNTSITEAQEKNKNYEIYVEISAGKRNRIMKRTLGNDGKIEVTQFIQKFVQDTPVTVKKFSLNVKIYKGNDLKVQRKINLNARNIMSKSARADEMAYRNDRVDHLNKILLRKRSHKAWRMPLLDKEVCRY